MAEWHSSSAREIKRQGKAGLTFQINNMQTDAVAFSAEHQAIAYLTKLNMLGKS